MYIVNLSAVAIVMPYVCDLIGTVTRARMRAIRLLINMRMLTLVQGLAHFSMTAASHDLIKSLITLSLSHPSSSNGSVVAGAASAVAPDILGRFPLRKRSRIGRVLAELTLLLLVPTASQTSLYFFFMNEFLKANKQTKIRLGVRFPLVNTESGTCTEGDAAALGGSRLSGLQLRT